MAWLEARNSTIIKAASDFLGEEPSIDKGEEIEVEAKFTLSRGSEGSRHLAYQTIMLFSSSAKRIESVSELISGGGRDVKSNIPITINKKKLSIGVTKYNSSNLRSRRIGIFKEPHQLNPNGNIGGFYIENIAKRRVSDLSIPMIKGSNRITISTSIESKSDRNIFIPGAKNMRTTVRYDVTNGLREFLNLQSESTITIDIEYTGHRDIKLEVEAGQDDEYNIFMKDVLTIEDYIINYPVLNRPIDISSSDLTYSTFFNNGPYLLTMKNNGSRRIVFFDLTIAAILDSAGRLINTIPGNYEQLSGYCLDLEWCKNSNNIIEYVVLDASDLRSSRKMTHTHRVSRLRYIIGDNYNIEGIPVIFKEFRPINNINDYYNYMPEFVSRIDNLIYDGIVLIPDYRPFALPYPIHDPPKIFRYKKEHTIDINVRILSNVIEDNRSHKRYRLIVDQAPKNVSEYAIKSVIRQYDEVGEIYVVDLALTRDRPDRSTPNNITNIIKMVEIFREGITLNKLIPSDLRQIIKLNRADFNNPTSIEVIGNNDYMRDIIARDLTPPSTDEDDNPIRIILFPDDHYNWDNIDESITTYIIGHSYIRLLRALGEWGNISVTLNSPTITVIDNDHQYEYSQDIGNRITVDNWMSLIPDSLYLASKYGNSLVVVKLGAGEMQNPDNYIYEDKYNMPRNRLTELFWNVSHHMNYNDLESYLLLSSLGAHIQSEQAVNPADNSIVIDAYNGPTWWLPSMSYPILSNITAITMMHYLSGMPYNQDPNTVLNRMITYLHPLGMVDFVNLASADMEDFLTGISNEYSTYMTARFLSSFILLFKVILKCEIFTNYEDVTISSGIATDNAKFSDEYIDQGADKNRRLVITNIHSIRTVATLPGMWVESYSVHQDRAATYRTNVNKLINIIRPATSMTTTIDLKKDSWLIGSARNANISVVKYCDLCTAIMEQSAIAAGQVDLAGRLNRYSASTVPRSFVFRDVICPNNRLIIETVYMSFNWAASPSNSRAAIIPQNIYDMLDKYAYSIVL